MLEAATEQMLPKLELDAIRMYLEALANEVLPSLTPSATTPRSRSSNTKSATFLDSEAAESTTIPTSADVSAGTSFAPSPI